MPISPFQKKVLSLLKRSRNPESYVAGGTAIQRREDSIRYSRDIDFFHDSDEAVTQAFSSDRSVLLENGYAVEQAISQPSFYRVIISKRDESLKLEWVRDTAFRFFPVIEDKDLGFRLHDADLAINKCLALANRTEVRDILDIIEIDSNTLSLAGCVWAGCGKDPGFTPDLLLEMIQRHAIISPDKLTAEALAKPVDPQRLKKDLLAALERAKQSIPKLDPQDIGCLFLDKRGNVLPDPTAATKASLRHFGSVKGSWPRIVK